MLKYSTVSEKSMAVSLTKIPDSASHLILLTYCKVLARINYELILNNSINIELIFLTELSC